MSKVEFGDRKLIREGIYTLKLSSLMWIWNNHKLRQVLVATFTICDHEEFNGMPIKMNMDITVAPSKSLEWQQKNYINFLKALKIQKLERIVHSNDFYEVNEEDLKDALLRKAQAYIGVKEWLNPTTSSLLTFNTVDFNIGGDHDQRSHHESAPQYASTPSQNQQAPKEPYPSRYTQNVIDDEIPF